MFVRWCFEKVWPHTKPEGQRSALLFGITAVCGPVCLWRARHAGDLGASLCIARFATSARASPELIIRTHTKVRTHSWWDSIETHEHPRPRTFNCRCCAWLQRHTCGMSNMQLSCFRTYADVRINFEECPLLPHLPGWPESLTVSDIHFLQTSLFMYIALIPICYPPPFLLCFDKIMLFIPIPQDKQLIPHTELSPRFSNGVKRGGSQYEYSVPL